MRSSRSVAEVSRLHVDCFFIFVFAEKSQREMKEERRKEIEAKKKSPAPSLENPEVICSFSPTNGV